MKYEVILTNKRCNRCGRSYEYLIKKTQSGLIICAGCLTTSERIELEEEIKEK